METCKSKNKVVLFSCVGTSDPVRGAHDGPMLHIMRNYRPDVVYLLISPGIKANIERNDSLNKTFTYIREHWEDKYNPELVINYLTDLVDASDIDEVDKYIYDEFLNCKAKYPDYEFLINISSGTTQMQLITFDIAANPRYQAKGIQVKTFEHSAGTADRTNSSKYDIDLELECNEDEALPLSNRCIEPELLAFKRQGIKRQIEVLLEKRDFPALIEFEDYIPDKLFPLVKHLSARIQLNWEEAVRLAKEIDIGIDLYPRFDNSAGSGKSQLTDYWRIIDYALLLKCLIKAEKFSEFTLRLDPLIMVIQKNLLNEKLHELGPNISTKYFSAYNNFDKFIPDNVYSYSPDLYNKVEGYFGRELKESKWSFDLYNSFLKCFSDIPRCSGKLFETYGKLKETRNITAHELNVVTEKDIKEKTGTKINEIMSLIEGAIKENFSQCNPKIFNVYDNCVEYILKNI